MNTILNTFQIVPGVQQRHDGLATKLGARVPVGFGRKGSEKAFKIFITYLPAGEQPPERGSKQQRNRRTRRKDGPDGTNKRSSKN